MSSSKTRQLLGLLGWFLLLPSGLTALAALWLIGSSADLWNDTRSATGRVVGHEQVRLKVNVAQKSVVEFTAHDGRALRFVDPLARQQAAVHKVGESVKVRYPVRQPEQAQIAESVVVQVVIGSVLLLFGALGAAAGALLLRLRSRAAGAAAPA
ncbi:DUF3592 domain-containing protein [Polaromonas sp.]|uniref:DUF3592 domain-containing protein n=1 Tax=Polaromonas sp. TaxID=1869339 RepID=UPI003262EBCF